MDRENTAGMAVSSIDSLYFLQVQYPTSGVVYRSVDGAHPISYKALYPLG